TANRKGWRVEGWSWGAAAFHSIRREMTHQPRIPPSSEETVHGQSEASGGRKSLRLRGNTIRMLPTQSQMHESPADLPIAVLLKRTVMCAVLQPLEEQACFQTDLQLSHRA